MKFTTLLRTLVASATIATSVLLAGTAAMGCDESFDSNIEPLQVNESFNEHLERSPSSDSMTATLARFEVFRLRMEQIRQTPGIEPLEEEQIKQVLRHAPPSNLMRDALTLSELTKLNNEWRYPSNVEK